MQIFIAPHSGFCFGVRNAINTGEKIIKEKKSPVASWGPLIHNPQEVSRLEKMGIISRENFEDIKENSLVIRTHGVPPEVFTEAKKHNLEIIDCTCPFVSKVQRIAQEYSEKGYTILVLGDPEHPEIKGVLGWAQGKGITCQSFDQLKKMQLNDKICFVAQTTEKIEKFNEMEEYLKEKIEDLIVYNTICSATRQRQQASFELSEKVDLMIVVGGLNSANTQKLAKICSETGTPTKHIENAQELKDDWFSGIEKVGVTAGASTPEWIIEEVVRVMEEIKNQQEENQQEENNVEVEIQEHLDQGMTKFGDIKPGDILTGTVVQINNDEVLVDVGGKSEGIIPVNELSYRKVEDPNDLVKVGEEIKVLVLKVENAEGNMIISKRRAEQEEGLKKLEEAFKAEEIIEAEVTEVVKGGILVDVGVRGFIPASLVERGYVEDLEQYVGQKLRLKVIELDTKNRKAVLSRKAVLDAEYEEQKEKTWAELAEGQTRQGTVQRITDFGAFVDLGGVDGLLHVSEMAWGRVNHPRDIVKEGDKIDVYVISVDREKERVSLGLKQLTSSPWETIVNQYSIGSQIKGKVVRIAPFGVFVELLPGVDGLVHISQLAWERVEKPEDVVSIGEEVDVVILDIDQANKKIGLSIKEAKEKPVKEKKVATKEPVEHKEESGVTIGDLVGDIFNELK